MLPIESGGRVAQGRMFTTMDTRWGNRHSHTDLHSKGQRGDVKDLASHELALC